MSRLLFDAFDTAGSSSGNGVILSPPDGAVLNIDPEIARWTPIVAVLPIPVPQVPFAFAKIGTLSWTIYDGSGFTTMFAEHSTVTSRSGQWTLSILPNGGWWRSNIHITYAAGTILAD